MKIALYARVSTDDQSTELQLRDLRAYAVHRGFEIYEEYIELGVSGSKVKRPTLNRMMDDAEKGKFDAVAVWRFDRFGRSAAHLVNSLETFDRLGIRFFSYQENIDTGTPLGQAMFTIIAAMAQLERSIIIERVTAGMRAAKARGVHLGRRRTIIDPDKITNLRAKGLSIRGIGKQLKINPGVVVRVLKEHSARI